MPVRFIAFLLLVGSACGSPPAPETQPVTVFAAASLADAMEALADSFETEYPGYEVSINLAATSLLARQIEQGAPADVFFSASTDWMEWVYEAGAVVLPIRYPLGNRLVVAGPAGSDSLRRLDDLLQFERIAVAEPSSVPAGLYARAALRCLGLWEAAEPKLIPTLDVRTALLTVSNRAAPAAIVYATDVPADDDVAVIGVIPDRCQPEIRYAVARVAEAPHPEAGAAFIRYITAPARRAVWERYGFLFQPGTPSATP